MKTSMGDQCDFCNKMADKGDKFKDFILPPSISPLSGRPDGRFPGVASESNPRQLAELKTCPACLEKAKDVIRFTTKKMKTMADTIIALQIESIGDLTRLPQGRVRRILEQIKTKRSLTTLQ